MGPIHRLQPFADRRPARHGGARGHRGRRRALVAHTWCTAALRDRRRDRPRHRRLGPLPGHGRPDLGHGHRPKRRSLDRTPGHLRPCQCSWASSAGHYRALSRHRPRGSWAPGSSGSGGGDRELPRDLRRAARQIPLGPPGRDDVADAGDDRRRRRRRRATASQTDVERQRISRRPGVHAYADSPPTGGALHMRPPGGRDSGNTALAIVPCAAPIPTCSEVATTLRDTQIEPAQ